MVSQPTYSIFPTFVISRTVPDQSSMASQSNNTTRMKKHQNARVKMRKKKMRKKKSSEYLSQSKRFQREPKLTVSRLVLPT